MNHVEYDEYGLDPEFVHVSELEQIEEAKGFIAEALKCLYGEKPLEHLEFALEEACSHLDLPFPKGDLKIQKKNPYFEFGAALARNQAHVVNRNRINEGE